MPSNALELLIAGFTIRWGPCSVYTAPLLSPYIGSTKTNWEVGLRAGLLFSIGSLLVLAALGRPVNAVLNARRLYKCLQ